MSRIFVLFLLVLAGTASAFADNEDVCATSRDFPRKIEACSAVIARQPQAGWAYINRSYAHERLDRFEEALADANRAVRLSPREPLSFVNRAAAYIGLKQYEQAIEDANSALRLDPKHVLALVNRGYAYEKLGQRDRAIADYRRCLETDPSYEYARGGLKRLGAEP